MHLASRASRASRAARVSRCTFELVSFELELRDGLTVNLVRAVCQTEGTGHRPVCGQMGNVADTGGAVHLNRTVENPERI